MNRNLSVLLQEDEMGYHAELEKALKDSLGSNLVIHRNMEGITLKDDEILILVMENIEFHELRKILNSTPRNIMKLSIIFGYPEEDHKEILEQYEPYGLATSGAVTGWLRSGARPSRMLGNRNGLYGRKECFDPTLFMEELVGFGDTEHYMLFETIAAEELPKIIQLYAGSACK